MGAFAFVATYFLAPSFLAHFTMGCGTSKIDSAAPQTQQPRLDTEELDLRPSTVDADEELERTLSEFSLRLELDASPVVPSERKATPNPHRLDAKGATFHFPTYVRSPTSSEMASAHSSEEVPATRRNRRISDRSALSQTLKAQGKQKRHKGRRTTQFSELAPLFESV